MQKNVHKLISIILIATMYTVLSSCSEDDDKPVFPLTDESTVLFHSIQGKQVAFAALTHSAVSWSWDFGDGQTSTEQNPVHVYEVGGYYRATLTARDGKGTEVTKSVKMAVELTPYAYLTGDRTADNYQGKTWKLTTKHSSGGDYFAEAKPDLPTVGGTPKPLPDGIFDLQFGMGNIYKDTYTFFYDGSYKHDVKEDGASFGGLVYEVVSHGGSMSGVVNANGKDYGLCIAKYTPQANAQFTFKEGENLTIPSVYGSLSFSNARTLDFSGDEFIGFKDFQRKVIINSISETKMQLIMFMAAAQSPAAAIGVNTHALILSFEAVQ